MEDPRREFQVRPVRTRSAGRFLPVATFVVGLFLGAALIKPWDLIFPPSPQVEVARGAAVASDKPQAVVTPSPTPAVPNECAFAGGWRVFALGQRDPLGGDGSSGVPDPTFSASATFDIGNPLRRWVEIVPLTTASGPDDALIPFVTIVSDRIAGIGYCPPPDGSDGPPAASTLSAWLRDDGGARLAAVLDLTLLDATPHIEVRVYAVTGGLGGPTANDRAWPAGRYVFAVSGPDGDAYRRWFGVDLRLPQGRQVE